MARPVVSASWKRDWELRYEYYRPYWKHATIPLIFLLAVGIGIAFGNRGGEWQGVPVHEEVTTCVRSYPMSYEVAFWWMNTYLIGGQQRTTRWNEGCINGRLYTLRYRIGKQGTLQLGSQTLVK